MGRHLRALSLGLCAALAGLPAMAQVPAEPPPDEIGKMQEGAERQYEKALKQVEKAQKQRVRTQVTLAPVAPAEVPAGKSWLGVQLCPVPAALMEHLQLDGKGVMICNVFEDSPADKSGLERYDVITRADDKPTPGGQEAVVKFSELVRGKEPGGHLELTLIHHGKEKTISIKLAPPPEDPSKLHAKYEEDPDIAYSKELGLLRGKIFRPGPQGGWVMEDLGEFPGFREGLSHESQGGGGGAMGIFVNPGKGGPGEHKGVQEARRVDKEGNTLQVHRDEDGTINVKRYKQGEDRDQGKSKTYKNMDRLREEDKEAFDFLQSTMPKGPMAPGGPVGPRLNMRIPAPPAPPKPPMDPGAGGAPRPPEARRGPEANRDDNNRENGWREWERGFFRAPLRDPRERDGEQAEMAAPRTRFEVAADGQITVHTRDGDTEMSKTFKSRDQLREAAPKLFERFQEMESHFDK